MAATGDAVSGLREPTTRRSGSAIARREGFSDVANERDYVDEFWDTWSFLAQWLGQLREGGR